MTGRIERLEALADGQPQSFWGVVVERAARTPDDLCAVDEAGERVTFAEFRDRAEVLAAALAGRGIAKGAVVAWQLPTRIDSLVVCAALARLDVVQVPIIPIYRERELRFVLTTTRPSFLLTCTHWRGRDHAAEARELAASIGDELGGGAPAFDVIVLDEPLAPGDAAALPPPAPEPEAGRWIYFTSGTTGAPKGARHSDASLLWAAHAEVDVLDTGPDDRTTIVFPVAHIGGAFFFMAGLLAGHGQIVISAFDESSVAVLQREGVTHAGAGLSFQRAYLEAQRRQPGVPLFPGIRGFPHGGDAKRPHVHQALLDEIGGVGVLSGYGMTEFAMIASGSVHDPADKLRDRLGRPCAGIEVRIVTPDGRPCAPFDQGELRAKGPSMCLGYIDPADDVAGFDEEGFFRTGDVGFLDDDGYLELTGRLKDIIIRKGENISAVEVEDLLHAHPSIAEAAVVGVPDEERGELCCAVVVLAPGAAPLTLDEVVAFLLERGLMTQKCPERLERRDSLPRDFFAKLNKAELRASLVAG